MANYIRHIYLIIVLLFLCSCQEIDIPNDELADNIDQETSSPATHFSNFKKDYGNDEFSLGYFEEIFEGEVDEVKKWSRVSRIRSIAEYQNRLGDGLEKLSEINAAELGYCEGFEYYNLKAILENEAGIFVSVAEDQEPAGVYKNLETDIEYWASYYAGKPVMIDELLEFADQEILTINQAYQDLKTKFDIPDLNEFAESPTKFLTGTKEYSKQFTIALQHAKSATEHHFYDYDIMPIAIKIVPKCHAYYAYASYSWLGYVNVYDCGTYFDTKRNMFLASHEYFPGHHIHSQLGRMFKTCSRPIRNGHSNTLIFKEAIANYGEYLSYETLYEDPAQMLGWLDYRYIRAMRIKTDTLRLERGFSYPELEVFWKSETPSRLHDNIVEEYVRLKKSSRFQYLTYLMGGEAIGTARQKIETEMEDDFDEQKFHHVLYTAPIGNNKYLYEQLRHGMKLVNADLKSQGFNLQESAN